MVSSPKSKGQVSWLSRLNPNSPSAGGIPILEQVRHFILSNFTPEFPLLVDVQTKDGCNASCTFLPERETVSEGEARYHGRLGVPEDR